MFASMDMPRVIEVQRWGDLPAGWLAFPYAPADWAFPWGRKQPVRVQRHVQKRRKR